MKFDGFVGPAYTLNSTNYECQTCVNMYLEQSELGTGKNSERAVLLPRPGLRKVGNAGDGPWRGLYTASDGYLYGVCGRSIFRIHSDYSLDKLRKADGSFYEIVSLDPAYTFPGYERYINTRCTFADNGEYMLISTGDREMYVNSPPVNVKLSSGVCSSNTTAASSDIYGAYWTEYKTGRFLLAGFSTSAAPNRGKGYFWYSDLDAAGVAPTFQADQILQAEANPDPLWQIVSSNDYLWMAGNSTIEIWQTTADPDAPYQRVTGANIEYGVIGATLCKVNNTVAWCGSQQGTPHVYAAEGLAARRISNHGVEQALSKYDTTGAYAWSYSDRGHNLYVLSFPAESKTWLYDFATGGWSEMPSYDVAPEDGGKLSIYRGCCHAYAYGMHFVGDHDTGDLYVMDDAYYQDGTLPIYRERTSPWVAANINRLFYRRFLLDVEVGDVVGTSPTVVYCWSDDGGRSFVGNREATLGDTGEYRHRLYWQRLGHSRARAHRVRFEGNARFVILGAQLDVEAGAN